MPSGLTAQITEKNATFAQFVWSCARQFGALIMMRDDPSGAKIERRKVDKYYYDNVRDAKRELETAKKMDLKQATKIADAEFETRRTSYLETGVRHAEMRAAYEKMLVQVVAWTPPTKDHQSLKDFMIEQIKESIDWDCNDKYNVFPARRTPEEVLRDDVVFAQGRFDRAVQHLADEEKRCAESSGWVDQLAASVPLPKELT